MSDRIVEVDAHFHVAVDADTPMEARSEAASRVKRAIESIEGKEDGCAVGTSGGEPDE